MKGKGAILTGIFVAISHLIIAQPKVENLGNLINSEYNEINPVISPDGRTLYFARISHPQNTHGAKGSQDIWYSEMGQDNKWGSARRMTFPLNKDEYNCAYSISPDGNTMLIKGAYNNGTYETRGFSISKRTASGWAPPQKMPIPAYEKMSKGQFDCGYLSADGKVLIMAFSEKKGSQKDDLYVSLKQKDGSWSKIINLGPEVNTGDFTETTPFLAADGATLYFSSDRGGGLGSNDIYVCRRVDNSWKHWSKPVNLGPAINTDGYDAYYTLSASGEYAYLTTFKETLGKGDIVRIRLKDLEQEPQTPKETLPDPVVLVSGKVIDQRTGKPVEARIVYETLPDGVEVGTATSNPLTGEYKIVLPYGKKYSFRAIAPDFIAEGDNIDLTQAKEHQEITNKSLKLIPIEVNSTVRLNNIFFDLGKATLREESFPELDRLALTLNENPKIVIEIGGHTDNTGSNELNLKLSQDRADSVREYFIGKGIEPDRVASKGYGESKPVAMNDSDEGRQANRRVEFKILKK
ncbi:OmpA family protein [Tellurirhabdus bombi]|uniref:OmpA family protein n=1 Tax=Tellurirhabdus bombi TaxID=2907205 RepID=UPI001F23DD9D|nr:OmpA family protein [Tellurirhabdus bombi]